MGRTQTVKIQALDARNKFAELLELSLNQNKRFQIARDDEPVAWLISQDEMSTLQERNEVISRIIETDDALADTLAILANKELSEHLLGGSREVDVSSYVALENLLD